MAQARAARRWPLYFDPSLPRPLRVVVGPGDLLYLPSMWHHHVEQRACPESGWTVAVNYCGCSGRWRKEWKMDGQGMGRGWNV